MYVFNCQACVETLKNKTFPDLSIKACRCSEGLGMFLTRKWRLRASVQWHMIRMLIQCSGLETFCTVMLMCHEKGLKYTLQSNYHNSIILMSSSVDGESQICCKHTHLYDQMLSVLLLSHFLCVFIVFITAHIHIFI